jgi:hypothetical protein
MSIVELFVLGLPVACLCWTVTHEEIFRELRDYCIARTQRCSRVYQRKLFFLFTCEFCLSYYISAAIVVFMRFTLFLSDWRGYVISVLSMVWIANTYMSLYARLRVEIKRDRVEISEKEGTRERARAA